MRIPKTRAKQPKEECGYKQFISLESSQPSSRLQLQKISYRRLHHFCPVTFLASFFLFCSSWKHKLQLYILFQGICQPHKLDFIYPLHRFSYSHTTSSHPPILHPKASLEGMAWRSNCVQLWRLTSLPPGSFGWRASQLSSQKDFFLLFAK